jgi:uncharacterized protein (TIGR00251 family)
MKLRADRAIIGIHVSPRASKPGIGDWKTDPGGRPFLEVRVAAAPTDGAANEEVIRLLAKALGIPKSGLKIVSGQTSRLKRIEVPIEEQEIRAMLGN